MRCPVIAVTFTGPVVAHSARMAQGFSILRRLDNNQLLHVGWRETLDEAQQLITNLNEHWPADYSIEEVEPEAPSGQST